MEMLQFIQLRDAEGPAAPGRHNSGPTQADSAWALPGLPQDSLNSQRHPEAGGPCSAPPSLLASLVREAGGVASHALSEDAEGHLNGEDVSLNVAGGLPGLGCQDRCSHPAIGIDPVFLCGPRCDQPRGEKQREMQGEPRKRPFPRGPALAVTSPASSTARTSQRR